MSRLVHPTALVLGLAGIVAAGDAPYTKVTTGNVATDTANSFALAWGDLNGDGIDDLFIASGPGEDNLYYINNGDGTFIKIPNGIAVVDQDNSSDVALADVDGDGDLDIYLTDKFAGQKNTLYINQGNAQAGTEGTFLKDSTNVLSNATGASQAACFFDADLDGDLDCYVANTGGNNFYFLNQGGAQLGTEGDFVQLVVGDAVTDGNDSTGCVAGDVDGNSSIDLYVTNDGNEDNSLYLNDGSGVLTRNVASILSNDGGDSFDAAMSDLDDDGDLDVVAVNFGQGNFLYVNQGGDQAGTEGDFVADTASPFVNDGGEFSFGVACGDWDGDDDLDIAVANCCNVNNSLYENTGGLTFSDVTTGAAVTDAGWSNKVAFNDYDQDGDQDLVFANSQSMTGNANFQYRNGVLGNAFVDLGPGLAGFGGQVPFFNATGTMAELTPVSFFVANAAPSALTFLIIGVIELSVPFKGGTLVPAPLLEIPIPTDATGFWFLSVEMPAGVPVGTEVFLQTWVQDVAGPKGFAATIGKKGTSP